MQTIEEGTAQVTHTQGDPGLYAVFGQPVAHSLSPRIHAAFARQRSIALDYQPIEASAEEFVGALAAFAARGGCGANVTLPLKQHAARLCLSVSERARRADSVNTLVRRGEGWHGESTDGAGLIRDITGRHRLYVRGRRTLLLGAGGAARAVAFALLDAGVSELTISNRTPEHADSLADAIGDPERVNTRYWNDLGNWGGFDLVINATSAGHDNISLALPSSLLASRAICYDLSYGSASFGFLAWARSVGAGHAIDGLGMLVEQAAEAFEIWHGKRPATDSIYAELRAYLPGDAED
ncbi:MAG TPA: shikimate dehydrogenase [Dokdonella sp.]|uniref:shikimate dehydrogenase n=1 Tax=Dokdonella sp. TaxID=2291710 RepID=UPI002D7E3302|nr:shikimate dehydrogenase [Dokdonella sp.]HET9032145.1 shikimate dehydrogenase [Dokdonella sp.]